MPKRHQRYRYKFHVLFGEWIDSDREGQQDAAQNGAEEDYESAEYEEHEIAQ